MKNEPRRSCGQSRERDMIISRRSFIAICGAAAGVAMLKPAWADALKVAIILPGNITDKSWSQSGYEGIMQAKEKLEFLEAQGNR